MVRNYVADTFLPDLCQGGFCFGTLWPDCDRHGSQSAIRERAAARVGGTKNTSGARDSCSFLSLGKY